MRPRGADMHADGQRETGLLRESSRLHRQCDSLLRAGSQILLLLLKLKKKKPKKAKVKETHLSNSAISALNWSATKDRRLAPAVLLES